MTYNLTDNRTSKDDKSLVEIFTDGACSGNPGPGGWGALLRWRDEEREIWGGVSVTTNNRMELTAAIRAFETLKRPAKILLHTDSTYLKDGITQWISKWKSKGWKTANRKPVKNVDLWQQLDAIIEPHDIEWRWVRGHAGHGGNERADELARRGIDDPDGGSQQ